MALSAGAENLADQIKQEARRQADEVIAEARRAAEDTRRHAQEQAGRRREEILDDARRRAEATRRAILSAARLESRRITLAKRAELIEEVFRLAQQQLQSLSDEQVRKEAFVGLSIEAARGLGGGDVTLRPGQVDAGLIDNAALESIEQTLSKEGLRSKLMPGSSAPISGGVIALKEGGRIAFDNSFDARLERLRQGSHREVWNALMGKQGHQAEVTYAAKD